MKSIKNYNKVYKNRRSFRMVLKLVLAALLAVVLVTIVLFFVLKHFTVYENGMARVIIPWLDDEYPYSENMAGISTALRIGKEAVETSPNPFALPSRTPSPSPMGTASPSPGVSPSADASQPPTGEDTPEEPSPSDTENPDEEEPE